MQKELTQEYFSLAYKDEEVHAPLLWENHCHARFELIAVHEGNVTITPEGKRLHISGGELLIIPPLLYHTVEPEQKGTYCRTTVLFDLSFVPEILRETFLARTKEIQPIPLEQLTALHDLLRRMQDTAYHAPLIACLLTEILYTYTETATAGETVSSDRFLRKTIEYIDLHLCEALSLDAIAAYAARSKSSLCHLFSEKMNVSVKQYILSKRLALAAKLITEGTPPTLAAVQVGYENYSNFYRMYRKQFGHSPSERGK